MDIYINIINKSYNWNELKNLKPLSLHEICHYKEHYKMFLLIYYNYYEYIIKNYNNFLCPRKSFFLAVYFGRIKIIKYLNTICKINFNWTTKCKYNINAYYVAIYNGKINIMKYLEKNKINIYHKDNNGLNAYYTGIYNGKINIIKHLESSGHNIYYKTKKRNNVYTFALYNSKYQLLSHLESKETHLYLKTNIKTLYQRFNNGGKKFCRYKFNIGRFPYFLFILFIFVYGCLALKIDFLFIIHYNIIWIYINN